jgi:hypothetical protein
MAGDVRFTTATAAPGDGDDDGELPLFVTAKDVLEKLFEALGGSLQCESGVESRELLQCRAGYQLCVRKPRLPCARQQRRAMLALGSSGDADDDAELHEVSSETVAQSRLASVPAL